MASATTEVRISVRDLEPVRQEIAALQAENAALRAALKDTEERLTALLIDTRRHVAPQVSYRGRSYKHA